MGSAAVKASNVGLSLVVAVVLARVLGPEAYGVYSYVFALAGMMAIPAQFGLPALTMRETAKAQANGDSNTLKGIWRWSGTVAAGLSLVLAFLGGLCAWLMADRFTDVQINTSLWALVLVPFLVLGRLRGAAIRGLRHVVAGQLPEMVFRPGFFLALVLILVVSGFAGAVTAGRAMALHAVAAGGAFAIGVFLLRRLRPREITFAKPRFEHRTWALATIPLALSAGMISVNRYADILLLGLFVDAKQVGIYRVAVQGAGLVAFGLQALNMVAAPHFARMHDQGNKQQLQRLATSSARVAVTIAVPATLIYVVFGSWILRVVVGTPYVAGATPLAILAMGQLINAGMGSVGMLLNMTDHETVVTRTLVFAVLLNISLNVILIPSWGMNGAAMATAATYVFSNSVLARFVSMRLGINSTVIKK
jgi:O-antigen/teichoic acid export membrane protein